METIIIYSLKVSVAMALFYALHILLLRNETFFKIRRFYFLFSLLFSLVFPFISFGWWQSANGDAIATNMLSEVVIYIGDIVVDNNAQEGISEFAVLAGIVVLGILFLLGRFFVQTYTLFKLLRHSIVARKQQSVRIVEIEDDLASSFSFFNWIIINKTGKTQEQITDIVTHEMHHAKQYHSVDVLLYEVFCILFWWNPFMWLMKNETKLNLEYLADEDVLLAKTDSKDYQYTLLQISTANTGVAFINNFNVSHLKKRIMMMNKKRSSTLQCSKFILALPLALALLLGNVVYANPAEAETKPEVLDVQVQQKNDPEQPFTTVEEMPKFPGGEMEMMKYIGANLKYPQSAQDAKIEGRITIRFVIAKDGAVTEAEIIRGIDPACDAEALRVVEAMPNWTPGKQGGKVVPVFFTLPILFRLRPEGKKEATDALHDMSKALYVVDGKIVADISAIDPNTIESINVIKDKEAKDASSVVADEILAKAKQEGKEGIILLTLKK